MARGAPAPASAPHAAPAAARRFGSGQRASPAGAAAGARRQQPRGVRRRMLPLLLRACLAAAGQRAAGARKAMLREKRSFRGDGCGFTALRQQPVSRCQKAALSLLPKREHIAARAPFRRRRATPPPPCSCSTRCKCFYVLIEEVTPWPSPSPFRMRWAAVSRRRRLIMLRHGMRDFNTAAKY